MSFAPCFQTLVPLDNGVGLRPYAQIEGIVAFGSDVDAALGSDGCAPAEPCRIFRKTTRHATPNRHFWGKR